MQKIEKNRLSTMIVESLKQTIEKEGFRVGDKFYSEKILMEKLGVSRASVREAVRILEVSGVFTVKQGKGIFLRNALEEQFKPAFDWLNSNQGLLEEQFEVRLLLEPHGAGRAALNCDKALADRLGSLHDDFVTASENDDIHACIHHDGLFHLALAKASGNKTLQVFMKAMIKGLSETWMASLMTPGRRVKTIEEHSAVLHAVISGESALAENNMRTHLEHALADISRYLSENN